MIVVFTDGQMSWVDCVVDNDYEIYTEHPYDIRKKSTGRVISKWLRHEYTYCKLNGVAYPVHRVVALQFIPNPNDLPEVDHINHDTTDYHISNLRWCDRSTNLRNQNTWRGVPYEYFDEIPADPDDIIEVRAYGDHEFEDLYYANDYFYFYTGVSYRRLSISYKVNGSAFIQFRDINNKQTSIAYSRFKRLYDLL